MPEEEIDAFFGEDEPAEDEAFEVWEENRASWEVFCALRTQWIVRDKLMGSTFQGINYAAIQPVMWAYRVKDRRAVFDDVRLMEMAALEIFGGGGE